MTVERQRRAQEIVGQVLDSPPGEWETVQNRECGEDGWLRAEVKKLLIAAEQAEAKGFLSEADPLIGTSIGTYYIQRCLGQGGMGAVYLAEQTQPLHRTVALKIIKLGMDTRQVIARFETEREALSLMNHPNVAKVLDAGATDSGRPYFVMEFVEGVPITTYSDAHRLSTAERLELFIEVCAAVQHAHQKGIIHRDIKPSNVLISEVDRKPVPKVIDFGVAKATQQQRAEQTYFTETGQLVGTPGYMSPEQAGGNPADIDTRTDVYSLGVLLYESLVGVRPFDDAALRGAGYAEIQRMIRDVDPPKPSTRLSTLANLSKTLAGLRKTSLAGLRKELRGDLDWVIMKCLEKGRARRYETANAVAEELRRYLNREPVLAGPPTAIYRMQKFVRRNRTVVTGLLLVGFVLLGGIFAASWAALRIAAERDRAMVAEEAATRQNLYLAKAIMNSATLDARISDATVRDTIATAALQILEDQRTRSGADKPEALNMMNDLGMMLLGLNRPADAVRLLTDALPRLRQVFGPDHRDTLVGQMHLMLAYKDLEQWNEVEALALDMLPRVGRAFEPSDFVSVAPVFALGRAYLSTSRFEEAIARFDSVLAVEGFREDGKALALRGECLMRLSRFEEAESDLKEGQRRLAQAYPPGTDHLVRATTAFAELYAKWDKPELAAEWQAKLEKLRTSDETPLSAP